MRKKQSGHVANGFRVQEIILHEALDRRPTGAFGKLHPFGNVALQVEGQPVFRATGDAVHMAAHRPEEILRLAETTIFFGGQQADFNQRRTADDHAVDIFADPVERVQIAQPPLPSLTLGSTT